MGRKYNGKLTPSAQRYLDFLNKFPEGAYMLDNLKKVTTQVPYAKGAFFLSEFLGKNPSQIVQDYKADVHGNLYEASDKWEKIFKDFATYLEKKKYSSASVALYHNGAKALINANVPRRMHVQAKTEKGVSRTIVGVTFEDLKEIYGMCDVRERAIVAFLKDSGMSKADILPLDIGILENFDRGDQFIHLSVFRGKESVEYETFIGPNTVEALKAYFALRRNRGESLTPQSPLFVTEEKPLTSLNSRSVSSLFARIAKKSGKKITTHRLRKFFETYMALIVRHPIILKYWMGHKITKARDVEVRYIIPPTPEQLKLYQESYKNIDLTGGTLEERMREAAKEQFEKMLSPEAREFAQSHNLRFKGRKKKPEPESEKACEDGKHCQRLASEAELPDLLADGWHASIVLPSGKIVVER